MNFQEVINIVIGIIVSLGGGGAIILVLSNYFGGLFAKRFEEKIKANLQKEIKEYENKLDILKQTTIRYSDKQFEHYSNLWSNLYELKIIGDELWERATSRRFHSFSRQLKLTKSQVYKSSLFIEENHYEELIKILNSFSEYQIGKSNLIEYRSNGYNDEYEINQVIIDNGNYKLEYDKLILLIKKDLKKQIGGNI